MLMDDSLRAGITSSGGHSILSAVVIEQHNAKQLSKSGNELVTEARIAPLYKALDGA